MPGERRNAMTRLSRSVFWVPSDRMLMLLTSENAAEIGAGRRFERVTLNLASKRA